MIDPKVGLAKFRSRGREGGGGGRGTINSPPGYLVQLGTWCFKCQCNVQKFNSSCHHESFLHFQSPIVFIGALPQHPSGSQFLNPSGSQVPNDPTLVHISQLLQNNPIYKPHTQLDQSQVSLACVVWFVNCCNVGPLCILSTIFFTKSKAKRTNRKMGITLVVTNGLCCLSIVVVTCPCMQLGTQTLTQNRVDHWR